MTTMISEIKALRSDLSVVKTEVAVIKWMGGVIIAGIATLILKALF